jgi:hypothetical protein
MTALVAKQPVKASFFYEVATSAFGTFFSYNFERRMTAFAVYLSVKAVDQNLISSKN